MPRQSSLRRISLASTSPARLDEALHTVAAEIRDAMRGDVAVIFLASSEGARLERRALCRGDGVPERTPLLVELSALADRVARRREAVHLTDLGAGLPGEPGRPRLRPRGALMAAPIIHFGQTTGVLAVAASEPGQFLGEDSDFLLTVAAQLAGQLSQALIREALDQPGSGTPSEQTYGGAAGAPGIAIGQLVVVGGDELRLVPDRVPQDIELEVQAITAAVRAFRGELETVQGIAGSASDDAVAIFEVYRQLLGEHGLLDELVEQVRAGNWARGALRRVIEAKASVFEQLSDRYLQARGEDFREIGRRILAHLADDAGPREYPADCILAADEVGIVQLAAVPAGRLRGLVSRRGSVLSHTAVLARALNVPAVMGLADLPLVDLDGREVILDGHGGRIVVSPAPATVDAYRARLREEAEAMAGFESLRGLPAETPDGTRVTMLAKAGMVADIDLVRDADVEGIGLYRTEFTFMLGDAFPSEPEQVRIYREVLAAMAPRPVVMRTLDAGGDKALPYFSAEERNPFLGWRGIRMSLDHPDIFLTQLRAMLRAAEDLGNLRIMFPMVASVGELEEALALLGQARAALVAEGCEVPACEVGLMIEVPSAVYQIEALARRVDFVSVGTNDLVQYLLAVDRDNARVANRYDVLHPAVVRALSAIVSGAHRVGTAVGVCGEMAGEPEAVLLLLGMGIDDLSASPARLPLMKAVIRAVPRARAGEVVGQALALDTADEIRALLRAELERADLGVLLTGVPDRAELVATHA